MKNKKFCIKSVAYLFSLMLIFTPVIIFAVTSNNQLVNPLKFYNVSELINDILVYVIKVGGVVATLAFIWAGFIYVKAQGKPAELDKAKNIFINTCIGTAIILGATLISKIISGTLNSLTN